MFRSLSGSQHMAAHEGKKELEIYIDRDTPVPGASGDKIICTTYAKLAMIGID